jgi:hypothetical protein
LSEDSDKDAGKSTDSLKEENTSLKEESDEKKNETGDFFNFHSILSGFKEFLERTHQVDDPGSETTDVSKPKPDSQVSDQVSDVKEELPSETSESHAKQDDYFPLKEHLMHYKSFRNLISKKTLIMEVAATVIGAALIIYGVINSFVSVDKVADNVVFGERAMISVFFILIGVLLMAAAFARKLLSTSFLNKIHSELEVAEGRPKAPEDNSKDESKESSNDLEGTKVKDKNNKDDVRVGSSIDGENKK